MSDPRPQLRYVEFFPFKNKEGKQMFGVRDPRQISPHVLGLSLEAAGILQFLDGTRNPEEIRTAYREQWKRELPNEHLEYVIRTLDEACFLHNETYRRQFATLLKAFKSSQVREAYHAGNGYLKDKEGLNETLKRHFAPPRGPGFPNGTSNGREIRGMIVPHIDLRLGGHSYAWAYKELAEGHKPEVAVVLGTGHSGLSSHFSLTRKDFVTPLGRLPVDGEFVDRVAALCPFDLYADEFAHRTEHTIEFQALFLQHLFGNSVTLVPVLCSFSHPMVNEGKQATMIRQFIEALREAMARDRRRVCLVASADLAHVGPRYGDRDGFRGEELDRVKRADREMLSYAERVDGDGFIDYIAREDDRRRICGLSPIYTMLKSLEGGKGTLLSHDHGDMDSSGSVCSFASVVFEP